MSSAENQQERLGSAESVNWFLAGFIEGEGALCVSVKKHPTCRSGFYVDPDFFLYQHESGRRIVELARSIFETVPRNSRGDGERRAPCPNGFGRNRKEGLCDESGLEGQGTCTSARRGACENPQRPYVGHPCLGMKRWSSPHGDMRDTCLR